MPKDPTRTPRADAQRNLGALLEAARAVFATEGVDAPARTIAARAGVGVGTLYRHFPQRSDLVVAVMEREIDACADAAAELAAAHDPETALVAWLERYTELLATKQGLAAALHANTTMFDALAAYFYERMEPALAALLDAAATAGTVRRDVTARDLLRTVAYLSMPEGDEGAAYTRRMVAVLVDGLRFRAPADTR
jgi:AcrR family transcriptional regulator